MAGKSKRIQLSPNIGTHDLETKLKQAIKFLKQKDQVQIWMLFKGRLKYTYQEEGMKILESFISSLGEFGKAQGVPKYDGGTAKITINPKK